MNLRMVFINEFGRVRSGWRVTIFLTLFIVTWIFLGLIANGVLVLAGIDPEQNKSAFLVINGVSSLIPALLVGWLCGRYLDGLPFRALGAAFTKGWLKHLILGSIVGAVTIGIAVLIAAMFGGLSFRFDVLNSSETIVGSLGVSLVVFAVAAAFEEVLFRGYMLQSLNRSGLGWLAIALTSAFFGLVHLGNPGANLISTTNTVLAGIWFGLAYLNTRDLWFPFGIHLIWNWMQGSVFGIEVSGRTDVSLAPVFNEIDRGPAWLTGENYGIEASIACTIAILISIALIHFLPGIRVDEEMLAMTSHESQNHLP